MNNRIIDYTNLKDNEKKIYSVFGYSIPGGIDLYFIIISSVFFVIINTVGILISSKFKIKYFDFKRKKYFYGMFMTLSPFVISFILSKIKVNSYGLYEYLIQAIIHFFKPKNSSLNEVSNNKKKRIGVYIDKEL